MTVIKMARIFNRWFMTPSTEILLIGLVEMGLAASDQPFDLYKQLQEVKKMPLDTKIMPRAVADIIKSLSYTDVVGKALTSHLYFFMYFPVLWSALIDERPLMMIPWLLVAAIRNIILGVLKVGACLIICFSMGRMFHAACIVEISRQLFTLAYRAYVWHSTLLLVSELQGGAEPVASLEALRRDVELAARRRKAKWLAGDSIGRVRRTLPPELAQVLGSVSEYDELTCDAPDHAFRAAKSRSLDALFGQIECDLEMIESLLDRRKEEQWGYIEMSLSDRAARFLRLTSSELSRAVENKRKHLTRLHTTPASESNSLKSTTKLVEDDMSPQNAFWLLHAQGRNFNKGIWDSPNRTSCHRFQSNHPTDKPLTIPLETTNERVSDLAAYQLIPYVEPYNLLTSTCSRDFEPCSFVPQLVNVHRSENDEKLLQTSQKQPQIPLPITDIKQSNNTNIVAGITYLNTPESRQWSDHVSVLCVEFPKEKCESVKEKTKITVEENRITELVSIRSTFEQESCASDHSIVTSQSMSSIFPSTKDQNDVVLSTTKICQDTHSYSNDVSDTQNTQETEPTSTEKQNLPVLLKASTSAEKTGVYVTISTTLAVERDSESSTANVSAISTISFKRKESIRDTLDIQNDSVTGGKTYKEIHDGHILPSLAKLRNGEVPIIRSAVPKTSNAPVYHSSLKVEKTEELEGQNSEIQQKLWDLEAKLSCEQCNEDASESKNELEPKDGSGAILEHVSNGKSSLAPTSVKLDEASQTLLRITEQNSQTRIKIPLNIKINKQKFNVASSPSHKKDTHVHPENLITAKLGQISELIRNFTTMEEQKNRRDAKFYTGGEDIKEILAKQKIQLPVLNHIGKDSCSSNKTTEIQTNSLDKIKQIKAHIKEEKRNTIEMSKLPTVFRKLDNEEHNVIAPTNASLLQPKNNKNFQKEETKPTVCSRTIGEIVEKQELSVLSNSDSAKKNTLKGMLPIHRLYYPKKNNASNVGAKIEPEGSVSGNENIKSRQKMTVGIQANTLSRKWLENIQPKD